MSGHEKKLALSGLHLLLTYRCDMECDHCFVWGSPRSSGTMTLQDIREILKQVGESKVMLRGRFPEILAPDQMYGVLGQ